MPEAPRSRAPAARARPEGEAAGAPAPRRAAAGRPRRSHAERTAETRARIVAAVVESVAELGFQRTTAAEIVQRAGVTWGAVQHHFGGKDGMLRAVLEDSFARFAERLADLPTGGESLETRAALFVERAWEHFRSPHFRSTLEILLAALPDGQASLHPMLRAQMFDAWDGVLRRLFADARLAAARRRRLGHFALATLCGLAVTTRLAGGQPHPKPPELGLLRDALVRELAGR